MRFATVISNGNPAVVAAVGTDTPRKLDIARDMFDVLRAERSAIEESYQRSPAVEESSLRFLAPIPRPGKIVAIGLNYMDHCREQGTQPPEKPLIFAKMTSSVTAPGSVIEWDPSIATKVDYEAELAVIIGKTTRLVTPESALSYVFGYTCANDVTARDLQKGDGQWTRGKGLDTFCPLGPWIVSADEVPDPQKLPIRCIVSGELRQNSSTAEMIFDVKTLISYVSQAFTLYPGDILLTGTPAGVGVYSSPPRLLRDGDTVTVEIDGIGQLTNICRELTYRLR